MPAAHRGDAARPVGVPDGSDIAETPQPPAPSPGPHRDRRVAGLTAAAATVAALAGGAIVASGQDDSSVTAAQDIAAVQVPAQASAPESALTLDEQRAERAQRLSRTSDRPAVRTGGPTLAQAKRQALAGGAGTVGSHSGRARVESADLAVAYDDPRDIARAMIGDYGWSSAEYNCLDQLYISESGWDVRADNPTSSAYGIPQALPGEKMASAGADWETNPATQIEWGLGYIRDTYGTPCSAMSFKSGNGWY